MSKLFKADYLSRGMPKMEIKRIPPKFIIAFWAPIFYGKYQFNSLNDNSKNKIEHLFY